MFHEDIKTIMDEMQKVVTKIEEESCGVDLDKLDNLSLGYLDTQNDYRKTLLYAMSYLKTAQYELEAHDL